MVGPPRPGLYSQNYVAEADITFVLFTKYLMTYSIIYYRKYVGEFIYTNFNMCGLKKTSTTSDFKFN